MSDTPETIDAIICEMRHVADNFRQDGWESIGEELDAFADRIEAAYKREHADWHAETNAAKEARNRIACKMRYEFSAKCRACKSAPGSAAAMREALRQISLALWSEIDPGCNDDCCAPKRELARIADAALAAPARNCDRPECATAEGAIAALRANPCADHDYCKEQLDCAECATRWLLAPAEGKGAENG